MRKPECHIEQIIELLKEQEPDRIDLIEELEKSERKTWIRQAYVRFVSAERPNQPGSKWQFDENIVLEDETEGTIVLDILKDGRIGGIEFVSQIRNQKMDEYQGYFADCYVLTDNRTESFVEEFLNHSLPRYSIGNPMRFTFIILIMILCSSFGRAQDRFLTFVDGWMAKASLETNDGYETIGLGFASSELYDQDLRINKLNSDGQVTGGFSFEVDTVFGTSGRGQSSEMIELPNGNRLITGILIDTLNGVQHGALFEYSQVDETVTLFAAINDSQTIQFWSLEACTDSSIVCAGSWSSPGSGANSRVYLISLEGQVLWTQDFEWGNQFQKKTRPTEVLTLEDGNIAALFWEHDLDQPGFHDRWRARLSLMNSNGDILWTRYPGDHQNKKIRPGGIVEQDGEILVCYSDPYYYDDDGEWHPDTLNRVRFERYDIAGNITAQDSLVENPDNLLVLREPTQIMECSDGNFLVSGYQVNRPCFLAKITPSYETIWYERYEVHDYDNDSLGTQEFKILNVIETSDGGFLCTGSYFTPPDLLYPSGFQSGFALKVDEYGCLEEGCQVGLDEYFIGELEVWPNPSNGSVRIHVPENLRGSTLTIHDGLGRLVSTEIDLPSGILEYSISAPTGLYQVSLTANRVLYQSKLILQ